MQVPGVNQRALRKYGEFYGSLQVMIEAIEAAETLVKSLAERQEGTYSWVAPDKEEVQDAHQKVARSMEKMHKDAKKHEAELISREWAV